jgi:hypothetical protein
MTTPPEPRIILQLPRDGEVDRRMSTDPPLSVTSGLVVLEHLAPGPDGRLGPPEGGEVVMSVLSPEGLTREPGEIRDVVGRVAGDHEPPVILVEAAEELREDELAVVLDAADRADRQIILRVLAGG